MVHVEPLDEYDPVHWFPARLTRRYTGLVFEMLTSFRTVGAFATNDALKKDAWPSCH